CAILLCPGARLRLCVRVFVGIVVALSPRLRLLRTCRSLLGALRHWIPPSVSGALAPHHRSPTSALRPAGQDLGTGRSLEAVTVLLRSPRKASAFWITFLLVERRVRPNMIGCCPARGISSKKHRCA